MGPPLDGSTGVAHGIGETEQSPPGTARPSGERFLVSTRRSRPTVSFETRPPSLEAR
jgi:hypothetical protein